MNGQQSRIDLDIYPVISGYASKAAKICFTVWSTRKDLDTVDTVQVWDTVRNDTDMHGDHMRTLKSQDLQVVRGTKNWSKNEEKRSCLKLPEMMKKCSL